MRYFCLVCNEEFYSDGLIQCPHCHAVGDDIEEAQEEEKNQ